LITYKSTISVWLTFFGPVLFICFYPNNLIFWVSSWHRTIIKASIMTKCLGDLCLNGLCSGLGCIYIHRSSQNNLNFWELAHVEIILNIKNFKKIPNSLNKSENVENMLILDAYPSDSAWINWIWCLVKHN